MFAKLSALALFLASAAAQTITVPDQANWGTVISVEFDGLADQTIHDVDLLLTGVNIPRSYLIGYQVRVSNGDAKFLVPYVVDQGEQYQLVATELSYDNGALRSNIITVN